MPRIWPCLRSFDSQLPQPNGRKITTQPHKVFRTRHRALSFDLLLLLLSHSSMGSTHKRQHVDVISSLRVARLPGRCSRPAFRFCACDSDAAAPQDSFRALKTHGPFAFHHAGRVEAWAAALIVTQFADIDLVVLSGVVGGDPIRNPLDASPSGSRTSLAKFSLGVVSLVAGQTISRHFLQRKLTNFDYT